MNVILTTYQGAILGPIARVLGYILQALYALLANFGIENTGICMILFTFLVNGLMMPMQIKQQKFSKMSMIMNPEIQAIQKKYKNKKDQASQQKMSLETQAVYQKYGVSPGKRMSTYVDYISYIIGIVSCDLQYSSLCSTGL